MAALSFDSGDGGILSVDSHRVVPAPFLTKTYQLVDDRLTDDIVSWGEDGSTFVVWRPPEFARDLLPNYFKHNNFSSFVRQLNTYGFRKVVPDRWEFANDFFKRGERHLLCEIHRRKSQTGGLLSGSLVHYGGGSHSLSPSTSGEEHIASAAAAAAAWSSLTSTSPLQSPRGGICTPSGSLIIGGITSPVLSLSDENERLRRDNCLLLSELSRLQKLYDDAVLFLQQNLRLTPEELRRLRTSATSSGFYPQQQQQQHAQQHHQHQQQQQQQHAQQHQQQVFQGSSSRHFNPPAAHHNQLENAAGDLYSAKFAAAAATKSKFLSPEGAAPKASTIDFVDGKLKEMVENSSSNSTRSLKSHPDDPSQALGGPKLFGVVLHGRKRPSVEEEERSKVPKTEQELMLGPAAASEAPWLKFRATIDEGVCM